MASAADVTSTWDGSDNNWSDPAFWDSADFPNNGNGGFTYDAVINSGTVTLDVDATIQGLQLFGGTLTGNMGLTVNDQFDWTSGTLGGTGTLTLSNTAITIADGGGITLDRVVDNYGDATISSPFVVGTSQAVWNNRAGASTELRDTRLYGSSAGTFYNQADATLLAGNSTIEWDFQNEGTVDVDSTGLVLERGSNGGTINVQAGAELELGSSGGSFTNTGDINISATAKLRLSANAGATFRNESSGVLLIESGGFFEASSSLADFVNNGKLEFRGGGSVFFQQTSSVSGRYTPRNINDPPQILPATLSGGTWIVGPGSSITLTQLFSPNPDFWDSAALRSNNGVVVLDGPGSNITTIDSLWENAGTLEIRGGRSMTLSGRGIPGEISEPFYNTGTVRVGVGSTLTVPATVANALFPLALENAAGSLLEGEGTIAGSVTVQGTTISSNGTLTINPPSERIALRVTTGTSTLASGTLEVNGPMAIFNSGNFVIAAGATLSGSGELELQDGLLSIAGTLDKPVRITGEFEVGGTMTNATLDGATLDAPSGAGFGLLVGNEELNRLRSGTITVNGELVVLSAGTLILGNGAAIFPIGLSLISKISNDANRFNPALSLRLLFLPFFL